MGDILSYEKLQVWQKAIDFSVDVIAASESIDSGRKNFRLIEQLESCSTSIAMNIAEGKGRWSQKEFKHFLYISRGSLYETLTLIEILRRKAWIDDITYDEIREKALEINKMLNSLIFSLKRQINKGN